MFLDNFKPEMHAIFISVIVEFSRKISIDLSAEFETINMRRGWAYA